MKQTSAPPKNLLFLSYGEDLLQNKILQNQFVAFAKSFANGRNNVHVHSVVPISRTRLFKNKQWNQDRKTLQASIEASGGTFTYSTLPALASWLYSNLIQFLLFHHMYYYLKLLTILKKNKIQYAYCRGYHAALVMNVIKSLFIKDLKVHFDPRGLFIEEGLYLKKFGPISLKLWRKIEGYLYRNSDLVTFVSEPFERQISENFKIKNSLVVYTHADIEKFERKNTASKTPLVFCYLGQLDNTGWHRTKYLLQLFDVLNKNFDARFKIITQSNHDDIKTQAKEINLEDKLTLTKAKNSTEVAAELAQCHFAVMSYRTSESYLDEAIAATVVASKSGEYLAAGLPMICNSQLRGIADLLERYKVGTTYSIGQESAVVASIKEMLAEYDAISTRARDVAKNHFDLKKNVQFIEDEINRLCAP